jgi:hypothetical protein
MEPADDDKIKELRTRVDRLEAEVSALKLDVAYFKAMAIERAGTGSPPPLNSAPPSSSEAGGVDLGKHSPLNFEARLEEAAKIVETVNALPDSEKYGRSPELWMGDKAGVVRVYIGPGKAEYIFPDKWTKGKIHFKGQIGGVAHAVFLSVAARLTPVP